MPSYSGARAEPETNPPPCTNTTTGQPEADRGAHTFTVRKFWPRTQPGPKNGDMSSAANPPRAGCGAVGPGRVASRTPDHGGCATGGANRSRGTAA